MRKVVTKELKCTKCGRVVTIPRKASRNKSAGHIKHLWCTNCRKRTPHEEMAEFDSARAKLTYLGKHNEAV